MVPRDSIRRGSKSTWSARIACLTAAAVTGAAGLVGVSLPAAAAGNNALQLDGSSQYATVGTASQLRSATFTVELWFKRTGAGIGTSTGTGGVTAIPLIAKGRAEGETAAQDINYFFGIDATSGKLVADFEEAQVAQGGTNPSLNHPITGTAVINADSVWHHAAATYDGTSWNLYLDGNLDGTLSVGRPANALTNALTSVGSAQTTTGTAAGFFAGAIDEVRIWNAARSQSQIQATKDTEITSPQGPTLLGVWNLNEGTGTSLGDNSGNSITGAAVPSSTWVPGFVPPAASNQAPNAPTLNAPGNGSTGIVTSPTLDVGVSDPNVADSLTVTYFGRPLASGNFVQIAQHPGIASGTSDTASWAGLGAGQTFEWYVTVNDGALTTTGPTWTFHTVASTDPVFVGVGDIADCARTQDEATGAVIGGIDGNIWTAGDNVYPNGTATEFATCYSAGWGGTIKARTRPIPGNHDWNTGNLNGYTGYFGANATDANGKSYYSYDIPSSNWHIVNLDSECQLVPGGCAAGSPQELWLRADLTANAGKNVIALWHKPRFSSGTNLTDLQAFYADIYDFGVDILLDGHDHFYERLAPMNPSGAADPSYGIRQFTVGTGGAALQSIGTPLSTSVVRSTTTYGIMKLTLHATTYDWKFLPIDGSTFTDSGTGSVHGAPPSSASLLRVTTSPAVPSQISVDGVPSDSWGLTWVKIPAGSHAVCFGDVPGFATPACQNVVTTAGATTVVTGVFAQRGTLRVLTSPAVASTISVDGTPRDDWGMWTDIDVGSHQVCFGLVAGFDPPPCQTVNVTAGATTTVTGTFTSNAAALGATGFGTLQVFTAPAVPAQVLVDGVIRDSWGAWFKISPGSHTVCFTRVEGYTTPNCQTVNVTAGATTTVTGTYTARGFLRVITSPAVAGTVLVDGIPRNDWGMWTDIPTGAHQVCFGDVPGFTTPACQNTTVNAGALTTITGTYT